MSYLLLPFEYFKKTLNNSLGAKEPWQIVTMTASSVLLSVWLYEFIFQKESLVERGKKTAFRWVKLIPSVRDKINKELDRMSKNFEQEVDEKTRHLQYVVKLPTEGVSKDEILKMLNDNLKLGPFDIKNGRVSGTVYNDNNEILQLVTEVYSKTSYTNPLHPDVFPGLCKIEAEIIRMTAGLFNGDENVCGSVTSGGTESILMACKAYRDYGREVRGIKKPEIVIPTTAHSAFDKAAQYLGLKVRYVAVNPYTTQVDLKAMKWAINSNTIMLVGSAPNFPYGTMDDIQSISELGFKYNVPVHVDSCLGGFLTVFMEEAGQPLPCCDFRLPGVTSISADTHKYGFSPKGSSVILYRHKKYLHHQYTVTTDWPGGVYGSPTVSGSRAGGNIAVCWATMLNIGKEGYIKTTRDIIHTRKYVENGLKRMKGIYIFGQPVTSVIAIGSNDFDIFRLSDALNKLGWNLSALQFPSGIHFTLTNIHTKPGVADRFLKDIRDCMNEVMKNPGEKVEGKMAVYGVSQALPDRSIVADFIRLFLDSMYYTRKD